METVNDSETRQAVIAQAIRQATAEIISENRELILLRAKAKLVALGLTVEEGDLAQASK